MIIKFHFIADYGEGKKNTAYDRKGAFRKWILCTKRKDRQKKTSHSTNKRVVVIIIIVDLRSTRHTAYFKSTLPKKKKIQSTYTNQTQYYMFNKLINKLNQTKKKMKNEIQC